ncbi:hypothetical protein C0V75_14380 [Tabrizicola sp. TH137]|uniref:hypothetical protein n=1 Tax=Tabrizicola sp. TH137 TaxID=2067452 RepID=UPI000C7CF9D6|nr:hypothetical protein [Tabrizicola sp. TH137]PLL12066.1 hypothetical protein C0V75_14380 [Tabrizicola sp. TH137]
MSDASHGLPIHRPDPEFGRSYGRQGDAVPQMTISRGWWLLPAFLGGVTGWVFLFKALFF